MGFSQLCFNGSFVTLQWSCIYDHGPQEYQDNLLFFYHAYRVFAITNDATFGSVESIWRHLSWTCHTVMRMSKDVISEGAGMDLDQLTRFNGSEQ